MAKADRIESFLQDLHIEGEHPHLQGYVECFNKGLYYEAHDLLEHQWLKDGRHAPNYAFYKGLIQLAGAFVHLKLHHQHPQHRIHGARLAPSARLFRLALENIAAYPAHHKGFHKNEINTLARHYLSRLEEYSFQTNPWSPDSTPRIHWQSPTSRDSRKRVALIIPCFSEQNRLPPFLQSLAQSVPAHIHASFYIVDDGSPEPCRKAMHDLAAQFHAEFPHSHFHVIQNLTNRGKGYSIRRGFAEAATDGTFDAIGFCDADGASPAYEVWAMYERSIQNPNCSFIASRVDMLGKKVDKSWFRHYSGRIYATLACWITGLRVYDTQCGLKVFPASIAATLASETNTDGFAIDSDILMTLQAIHHTVEEVPIDWHDVKESKVNVWRDGPAMLAQLVRLRLQHIRQRRRRGCPPAG